MQQSEQIRPISTYDNLGTSSSSSSSVLPTTSKQQQQQQQHQHQQQQQHPQQRQPMSNNIIIISGGESAKQASAFGGIVKKSRDSENFFISMANDHEEQEFELHRNANSNGNGGTSHSIAAVKAALNDAKSKFFGINNYESAIKVAPVILPSEATPVAIAPATVTGTATATATTTATPTQMQINKPEPKYQNVPQRNNNAMNQNDHESEYTYSSITPPPAELPQSIPTEKTWRYATTYEQIPLSDLDAPQPSQAVYMSTTVPQNMKGMKIAGRHTPTRNSLRHSRMIVVNHKNNDSLQEAYSTHIRYLTISRQLLIIQLAIALLIVGLAIWILILAPNASILINPYLSGLSLLLASIAGLILLRRDHRQEQRSVNNCYKVLLSESYVFSALALIFCCLALVCAAIEFAELASAVNGACGPATSSLLSYRNCTCLPHNPYEEQQEGEEDKDVLTASQLDDTTIATTTTDMDNNYLIDKNCGAFRSKWKYLLAFSMALNTLGMIATFLYITLFICCHRNRKQFYTSV